ncbi:nucleoid-asociated protein [Salmonella enterica subsp. enterica serovar Typhimurium]|nr:nucleoid-asociated protein [Salmonella enterica subsp. enterica serovar Typhimurium]
MSLDINQIALHQLIKRDEQILSWSCAIHCWSDNHRCRDGG